jgi:hypothetical protein
MKGFLLVSFVRDLILLVASGVVVSSTFFVSFLEMSLSHLVAGQSQSDMMRFMVSQPQLIMYYFVLVVFLLVVVTLVVYYVLRTIYELSVLNTGAKAETSSSAVCCCVSGLRAMLFVAFFALIGLFACYWIFWGQVLSSAYDKIHDYVEMLAKASADPLPPEVVQGTDRMLLLIVFFLVSVSLNILLVMRAVFNKLVLLGTNPKGEVNRVSLFRVRPVDLTQIGKSMPVFRQLWVSFIFDSVELVTLAVWLLYPLFILTLWALEERCTSGSDNALGLAPLLQCVIAGRDVFAIVGGVLAGLLGLLLILYFFRFVEERALLIRGDRLLNPHACRLSHVALFASIFGLLFVMACVGAIISVVMLAKPLNSSLDEEKRISLAYPGLVLLCGSIIVLFYIGKKLTFAIAIHLNPKISFFFEGASSLSGTASVNNLKTGFHFLIFYLFF